MKIILKVFFIVIAVLLLVLVWIIGGFIIGMCSDYDNLVAGGVICLIILTIIWTFIFRYILKKNSKNVYNKDEQIENWLEILIFFIPPVFFIFYRKFKAVDSKQKIKGLLRWTLFGTCFYVCLLIIITHLDGLI